MNPKEMADKVDFYRGYFDSCPQPVSEDMLLISLFLRNLPPVPPTYIWNGMIRHAEQGDDLLNDDGTVLHWRDGASSAHAYPILRKLPPRFPPGEIVMDDAKWLRVVDGNGRFLMLNGTVSELEVNLDPAKYIPATDEAIQQYMDKSPIHIIPALRVLLRDKFGGGEGVAP